MNATYFLKSANITQDQTKNNNTKFINQKSVMEYQHLNEMIGQDKMISVLDNSNQKHLKQKQHGLPHFLDNQNNLKHDFYSGQRPSL